jgi:hypothetical protein
MPPASLSTLEVMIPGPMRAKKMARVLPNPLRETFWASAGRVVPERFSGKVLYPLLP